MNNLIIIGAKGHAKVVFDIASKLNKWDSIKFIDNDKSIDKFEDADYFVAIGDNVSRRKVQERLTSNGISLATLIHPSAVIGMDVTIGVGTVVMAGVVINPATKIGDGCIINTSASIDHDNIIEDYVHISPGANLAGSIRIGANTWIGIGCTIKNNTDICSDCVLGAGAVAVKNIFEPGTYIGMPARRLDK